MIVGQSAPVASCVWQAKRQPYKFKQINEREANEVIEKSRRLEASMVGEGDAAQQRA